MRTVIRLNEAERLKALVAEDAIVTQDSIYMRVRFASGEVKEHVAEDVEITPGCFALCNSRSSYVYWKDKGEWLSLEHHNREGEVSGHWVSVPGGLLVKVSNEVGTWCELISDGRCVGSGGLGNYLNRPIKGGYFAISRHFNNFEEDPEIGYAFVLGGSRLTEVQFRLDPDLPMRSNAKLPFVVFMEPLLAHKVMPSADGISSVELALPEANLLQEFPFPELLDNGELLVAAEFLVSEQGVSIAHPALRTSWIVTSVGVGKDAVHLVQLINGPYALVYGDSVHQLRVPDVGTRFYSDGERISCAFEVDNTVVIERLV